MQKKTSFAIIVLVTCLVILFGIIMKFPHAAHAAVNMPVQPTSRPTISVSPTALTQGSSLCSILNDGTYVVCTVTLSIKQPVEKGLKWTSSYSETLCYISCGPDYSVATLPSQGSLNTANPSAQVSFV